MLNGLIRLLVTALLCLLLILSCGNIIVEQLAGVTDREIQPALAIDYQENHFTFLGETYPINVNLLSNRLSEAKYAIQSAVDKVQYMASRLLSAFD